MSEEELDDLEDTLEDIEHQHCDHCEQDFIGDETIGFYSVYVSDEVDGQAIDENIIVCPQCFENYYQGKYKGELLK